MDKSVKQTTLAAEKFGAAAKAYLRSNVHAQGADLQRLTELTRDLNCEKVVDLGCGAGHASFAMAQGGTYVTAYDLSAEMLAVVATEAQQRGIQNIQTQQGPAEQLPFADASFDMVVTRFSAHHWADVPAAVKEIKRVLKADGELVVIDVVSPEAPLLDTILQTVEMLRDVSHVRDYRISEWCSMLQTGGFVSPEIHMWTLPMEFASWVARIGTTEVRVQALREVFSRAAKEGKDYFKIKPDGSFSLDVAWMRTQAHVHS